MQKLRGLSLDGARQNELRSTRLIRIVDMMEVIGIDQRQESPVGLGAPGSNNDKNLLELGPHWQRESNDKTAVEIDRCHCG